MKVDFDKFTGNLPYASELFGVFQPLLGWKSKRTKGILKDEIIKNYSDFAKIIMGRVAAHNPFPVGEMGVYKLFNEESAFHMGIKSTVLERFAIQTKLNPAKMPTDKEWQEMLSEENTKKLLSTIKNQEASENEKKKEINIIQTVHWLSKNNPSILNSLFFQKKKNKLMDIAKFTDPLENFGKSNMDSVLSPIGIVHLFREYFFELDTFLGPPAGHVWISPGGTVELIEISSRKTTREQTTEVANETVQKTENEIGIKDELADAIKEENRNDTKLGFNASAKYSSPFSEAQANTSLNLDSSRTVSREMTQKHMREQSEKLSSEIKRSFKSTFKVSTETEESSSKRYVIENKTDKLVNYELRRKMRRVGVQVQDINTQLCWQVFVDNPGDDLGISKLVHIAEPPDLSSLQPPTRPAKLMPKTVEEIVQFPYENAPGSDGEEMDVTFFNGDDREGWPYNNDKIIYVRRYRAAAPSLGYTMDEHIDYQINHSSIVSAEVKRINDQGEYEVTLKEVNFDDQPNINIKVTTYWNPPVQSFEEKEYDELMLKFDEEKIRLQKEAYVKAAQERITMASKIQPRNFEELREEERIIIYRKLVKQLMSVGGETNKHIMSELIRSMFDIDNMLYYVAPEWWQSRLHQSHQTFGTTKPITEDNIVSWGGTSDLREDNYFITNDSQPAKLGSSLGWLLQLDGDNMRNAFLNSPWVKAVIPIRPWKEMAALNWLQEAHVEGTDGLDAQYYASQEELQEIKPDGGTVTIKEALEYLAKRVQEAQEKITKPSQSPFDPDIDILPTEIVYEHGFNPISGGVKVNEEPFRVFSQWMEVLPTDQIVALEYNASEHM